MGGLAEVQNPNCAVVLLAIMEERQPEVKRKYLQLYARLEDSRIELGGSLRHGDRLVIQSPLR